MSDEFVPYSRAKHPAKHRERVSLTALFYGMFAAPIAFSGTQMFTYALDVHACYPGPDPLPSAIRGFGFAWPVILAAYLVALIICVSAGIVSYRNWLITGSESEGHAHHLMEVGEGRTRYLSLIGMAYSTLFFATTMYGIISLAFVPLCGY